jgi:hypothetical protein
MKSCLLFLIETYQQGCLNSDDEGYILLGRSSIKSKPPWFPQQCLEIYQISKNERPRWFINRLTERDWITCEIYHDDQWQPVQIGKPAIIDGNTMIRVLISGANLAGYFIFHENVSCETVSMIPQVWESHLWRANIEKTHIPGLEPVHTAPTQSETRSAAHAAGSSNDKISPWVSAFKAIAETFATNERASIWAVLGVSTFGFVVFVLPGLVKLLTHYLAPAK